MTPRPRIYKREYAVELLKIAIGDLESARVLSQHQGGRLENVAYLAHQAAEKSLKALLCHFGEPIPFTHDIAVLNALIPKGRQPRSSAALESLTEFALARRYEESPEVLSADDFKAAVDATDNLIREITGIIGS